MKEILVVEKSSLLILYWILFFDNKIKNIRSHTFTYIILTLNS